MSRAGRLERKPALAVAFAVVFFAWMYLPILAVVVFSFNDVKSLSSFNGFSTRWYVDWALLPSQRWGRSSWARCSPSASSGSGHERVAPSERSPCCRW